MKKSFNYIINILIIILSIFEINPSIITTLNNNDPAPLFKTLYPYTYLYQNEKEYLKERTDIFEPQYFSLSISPFIQVASKGKDINRNTTELGDLQGRWNLIAALPFDGIDANDIPEGEQPIPRLVEIRNDLLSCIQDVFASTTCNLNPAPCLSLPDELSSVRGLISLQKPDQLFGFLSVPIKYRKIGVRFEVETRFFHDFGFSFQTGVADISQVACFVDETISPRGCLPNGCSDPLDSSMTTPFGGGPNCPNASTSSTPPIGVPALPKTCEKNTTLTPGSCKTCAPGCSTTPPQSTPCPPTINPPLTCANPFTDDKVTKRQWNNVADCVHTELMDKLPAIAKSTGIDLCNFNKTSIEDVHLELWWRHAFNVDPCVRYPGICWSPFLFIPFASVGASIGTGAQRNLDNPLSVPFGNNGHHAIRFNAGFSLDFYETIEIGLHAGVTAFFRKNFKGFRVPTNQFQTGIIPYKTNVEIKPGETWHIGLTMNAVHFLGCLSAFAEYLFVNHTKDKIRLCAPNKNNAFKPEVLECKSPWTVHLFNVGINYDISPNFTIGTAIQIPLDRRNAYKSTTYMVALTITY